MLGSLDTITILVSPTNVAKALAIALTLGLRSDVPNASKAPFKLPASNCSTTESARGISISILTFGA